MVIRVRNALKLLRLKVWKLVRAILKLWKNSTKFRYSAIVLAILTLGFMAGYIGEEIAQRGFQRSIEQSGVEEQVASPDTGVAGGELTPNINDINSKNLLKLTNQERKRAGVGSLKINSKLSDSALAKCRHMIKNDYWSHDAPDGTTWQIFIQNEAYNYSISGENLAYSFATSSGVITGWMNSETHRKNLLTKDYTEVGFGVCEGDNYKNEGPATIVVQHLAAPGTAPASQQYTPEPYKPPVCKKTPIPFKTVYEEVTWLDPGETESFSEGRDGYIEKCTADSTGYKPEDLRIEPFNQTIYIGIDEETP